MKNKRKTSISIKIALLVMIVSFFGVGIISYFSYSQAKEIFIQNTAQRIARNVNQYKKEIENNMDKLKYNIRILTFNPSTRGFFRAYLDKYKYDAKTNRTFSDFKEDLITIMSLMIKQNPSYYQIRILNDNGDEIIKLEKDDNVIIQTPYDKLRNQKNKEYFKKAMEIGNDIYISNINLNKEFNKLEFPLRPTIRIAKSVFINGKKVGVIVINSNIKKLFEFNKLKNKDIQTYISDLQGYYILNYKAPVKEFGFEFGRDYKIYYDFPILKQLYDTDKKSLSKISNENIIEARKVYFTRDKYFVITQIAPVDLFKQSASSYMNKLILFILLVTIGITLITTILVKKLTKPIEELTIIAKKIAASKGSKTYDIKVDTNDEIEELAKAFKVMLKSLEESKEEIKRFASNLEIEVEKKTQELQKVNENLQHIVEEKVNEVRDKEKLLLQQSKMAAMGEMIGAIAHQWRQPLNSLALKIQLLEDLAENNELNKKEVSKFVRKNMQTIDFMSQTIDDFRNFFRKDKEAVEFNVKDTIEKTISLQKAQLQDHNIAIETLLEDAYIKGYKNEFMQVILNLISNAKDAIEDRRKKIGSFEGKIFISDKQIEDKVVIKIRDNGGGISDEIKERIFEPYFTTKEEGKGTGIGLYMVKEIVERMNGKIEVKNIEDGAEFVIEFTIENKTDV